MLSKKDCMVMGAYSTVESVEMGQAEKRIMMQHLEFCSKQDMTWTN